MTGHRLVVAARPELADQALRILAPIEAELAATEALLTARLASDVPFIRKTGEYVFAGGGKRMRPALLLPCARLIGRRSEEAVTYAAVVELIHTATLIHDDIIDHAELRRGRRTVHTAAMGYLLAATEPRRQEPEEEDSSYNIEPLWSESGDDDGNDDWGNA